MLRRVRPSDLARTGRALSRGAAAAPTRLFGATVSLTEQFKLATTEGEDDTPETRKKKVPKYKWLHVASEGEFAGHADGEFELNRAVFTEFIKNFHADPRYKAPTAGFTEGTDGGMKQVLPFDFEHASELAATEGSIPVTGAPAPAWAMEVELRDSADGTAQLWAYAKLGDRIRSYIAEDEYRHVSIAFALDASDPETDASIGARLSSIAFTNHPFLRGLTSIAARDGGSETKLLYWYDAAGSPEQGLEFTRKCLGLGATATAEEVKAEVAKIAAFAAAPETTPPGVDVDDVFESLRKIWSLPVSATVAEVLVEVEKAATMAAAAAVAPPPAAPAADAAAAATLKPAPTAAELAELVAASMAAVDAWLAEDASRTLASYPWSRCTEDHVTKGFSQEVASDICAAVKRDYSARAQPTSTVATDRRKNSMKDLIKRLFKALGQLAKSDAKKLRDYANNVRFDADGDEKADAESVVKFVEELVKLAEGGAAELESVLSALDLPDAISALAAIPELMAARSRLTAVLQQLDEAMSMQAAVDSSMEEVDAEAAAEAKGLVDEAGKVDEAVLGALKAHRDSLIAAEHSKLAEADRTPKRLRDATQAGRSAFLTQYGVVEEKRGRLLKNLVAGPNGVQYEPPESPAGGGGSRQLSIRRPPRRGSEPREIDLSSVDGPNEFARLMEFVRREEKLTDHNAVFNRTRLLREMATRGEVVITGVEASAS